jgi:C4-dicarboxylate-specific signal transduction histidine kinase
VWNASLPLMIGDVIGIAVVTPLLLRFVFHRRALTMRTALVLAPELMLLISVVAAALAILDHDGSGGHKVFYVLFLPIVAAALHRGLDGACLALALTQFGLVGLLHARGYDAQVFTEFQTQMLVLTATGLIVGVTVSERRNADRHAREAEARLKQKEADAAQAARFNLVSGMASALAHEITQPMTAARALARSAQHILRMPGGDLARADGNLTTMVAQIDHAGEVLRHVRDFLRRGTPQLSTIEIATMIEDSLVLARADASARNVTIELALADGLPVVHGDHVQLQQVLLNLLRNALEAIGAGAGGVIRISAQALDEPPHIEIAVVDNGPGVADELAERLFEPLTTSKHEGLGLGLSICASIVAAHGGRIWLHCRDAGRTEFRFSLPHASPVAA